MDGVELKGLPQPPDKPFNPKRRGFFGDIKVPRPRGKKQYSTFNPKKRGFFGKIRVRPPRAKKFGPKRRREPRPKMFGPKAPRLKKFGPKPPPKFGPKRQRAKKFGPKLPPKFGPKRRRIRSGPKLGRLGRQRRGATAIRSSRSRSFRPKKNVLLDKIVRLIKARVRKATGSSDFRNHGFTGSRNGRTGWAGR